MWREAYEGQWELEWGDGDEWELEWEEDCGEDFSVEQRLGLESSAAFEACDGDMRGEWTDWVDNQDEQDTFQEALVGRPKAASVVAHASTSLSQRACTSHKQAGHLNIQETATKKRPGTGAEKPCPPKKYTKKSMPHNILQGHSNAESVRVNDVQHRLGLLRTAVKSAPAKPPRTAVKSAPTKPPRTAVKSSPAKPPLTAVKSAPTRPPSVAAKLSLTRLGSMVGCDWHSATASR